MPNRGIQVGYKVEGLDELLSKATPMILAKPLRKFFASSGEQVRNSAKMKTPVHFGHLRRSMASEVDTAQLPMWAKIGTNVPYAKPVEYGTGLLSEAPDSKRRRYFPPPEALQRWAELHGFPRRSPGGYPVGGFLVARAIYRRGGTHPKRMLRDGLKDSFEKINTFLKTAADEVERAWGRPGGIL
jgi:hypothetical protein